MNKIFTFLLCLLFGSSLNAQKTSNINVSTTDDKMIITYDLAGDSKEMYDIELSFRKEDNTILVPKALNGDVGKVQPGTNKRIIWDVYKDVSGISGKINPIINAKQIASKKDGNKLGVPIPPVPGKIVDILTNSSSKKERKPIRFGIKLGIGGANVIANQRPNFYAKDRSYEAGLFLRYNASRRFYVQPEVVLHTQHYGEILNATDKVIHKHNYVRPQVMVGISPLGMGLFFNAGIYYGKLISGLGYDDLELDGTDLLVSDIQPAGTSEFPFKEDDLGYVVGATWSFSQGGFAMGVVHNRSFDNFVEGNYSLGETLIEGQSLKNKSTHFFIQKAF